MAEWKLRRKIEALANEWDMTGALAVKKGDTSIVTNEYYTSIEKFNAAEKNYQGFNAEIWDFIGYEIPVFKTYNGTNITKKA